MQPFEGQFPRLQFVPEFPKHVEIASVAEFLEHEVAQPIFAFLGDALLAEVVQILYELGDVVRGIGLSRQPVVPRLPSGEQLVEGTHVDVRDVLPLGML